MNKWIVVGLGNVGEQYLNTRHNLGIDVVRSLVDSGGFTGWKVDNRCHAELARVSLAEALCVFPLKFMNKSGEPLKCVAEYYKVPPDKVLVVHDDMELPLGKLELVFGGSARGHNGVRSIEVALGTGDFWRLRLGIGRPAESVDVTDFVLSTFREEEVEPVKKMALEAIEKINNLLAE